MQAFINGFNIWSVEVFTNFLLSITESIPLGGHIANLDAQLSQELTNTLTGIFEDAINQTAMGSGIAGETLEYSPVHGTSGSVFVDLFRNCYSISSSVIRQGIGIKLRVGVYADSTTSYNNLGVHCRA